jgi:hypothetical protein
MTLQLLHSEFPYILGKNFFFISVQMNKVRVENHKAMVSYSNATLLSFDFLIECKVLLKMCRKVVTFIKVFPFL